MVQPLLHQPDPGRRLTGNHIIYDKVVYGRRCRRIVTTASAGLINLNVVYGGVMKLITEKTFVTQLMVAENMQQTADITSLQQSIYHVLPGTFRTII